MALRLLAQDVPPPPTPPTPPTGAALSYYSTSGGAHPPLRSLFPTYPDDPQALNRYREYTQSPAYKKYELELERYKQQLSALSGQDGEVDPRTGTAVAKKAVGEADPRPGTEHLDWETPATFLGYRMFEKDPAPRPQSPLDPLASRIDRDPVQDLARWIRQACYHETGRRLPLLSGAEPFSGLQQPASGPSPDFSGYWLRTLAATESADSEGLALRRALRQLAQRWQETLKARLRFDSDLRGERLAAEMLALRAEVAALAQRPLPPQHPSLGPEPEVPERRWRAAREESARRDSLQAASRKLAALEELQLERSDFLTALVSLVRVAPQTEIGQIVAQKTETQIRDQALAILEELGPAAGLFLWEGLAQELRLLDRDEATKTSAGAAGDAPLASEERSWRLETLKVLERLLAQPRFQALPVLARTLRPGAEASEAVLLQALTLLERQFNGVWSPEWEAAFPGLVARALRGPDRLAGPARQLLAKILALRGEREELRPLVVPLCELLEHGGELSELTQRFLIHHSGCQLPQERAAWLRWAASRDQERDDGFEVGGRRTSDK